MTSPTIAYVLCANRAETNATAPIRVFLDKAEADLILAIDRDAHPYDTDALTVIEVPIGLAFTFVSVPAIARCRFENNDCAGAIAPGETQCAGHKTRYGD